MSYSLDNWHRATDEMQDAVNKACRKAGRRKIPVVYSAWTEDKNDMPVNNLDDVAAKGTFTIRRDSEFFGNGKPYVADKKIKNPTWLQLAVLANESIIHNEDYHHVFFEGIEVKGRTIKMYFGS